MCVIVTDRRQTSTSERSMTHCESLQFAKFSCSATQRLLNIIKTTIIYHDHTNEDVAPIPGVEAFSWQFTYGSRRRRGTNPRSSLLRRQWAESSLPTAPVYWPPGKAWERRERWGGGGDQCEGATHCFIRVRVILTSMFVIYR